MRSIQSLIREIKDMGHFNRELDREGKHRKFHFHNKPFKIHLTHHSLKEILLQGSEIKRVLL